MTGCLSWWHSADAVGEGTAPAAATPSETDTSPPATTPAAPASGEAPSAATATPSATPASATPATESPDADRPAVDTAPDQVAPATDTGSNKLPELLHAAGATSSRDTTVGALMITLFLASAATIYVQPV
jgi:hypothetical protein